MSQIIPIKDLKDTAAISNRCNSTDEPIFITKNGYGDMVIMSMKVYESLTGRRDSVQEQKGLFSGAMI